MNKPLRNGILPVLFLLSISISRVHAQLDYGKSYENITKGISGGTYEPGDTLEIRATFVVRGGTYDSCSFTDNIPAGTAFVAGSIRVLTNEGKIYKQFTDAMGDDAGWYTGTSVTINLGYNKATTFATVSRRGTVKNTDRPSFYSSTCIMVASYRVRITAPLGSSINAGGGGFTYKNGASPVSTIIFPNNLLAVYTNIGMCPNTVGVNALGTESNGTFGSGKPRNRGTSANVPPSYTYAAFDANAPNDYYYGIANNTSTRTGYTTVDTWAKPDASSPSHRVFNVWDIIGDHTGAASPTAGNPPADTVASSTAGYMLVINASYRIDSAFQQTISGLCPNTYYEISCWMRNICSKCGCDSTGKGASGGAGYIPTALNDSSGVYPNLTMEVDGIDYYTTGDIKYSGQWVKKGFTFLTGPSQTSFTLKFFNNAPGGGGNDWALDDIAVATCYPNLIVNPTPTYTTCSGNVVNFGASVRSYFSNYVQYKWQKSTNGGSSWSDVGVSGTGVPVLSGGQYTYNVNYPPFIASSADSGSKYRIVVGTTVANLTDPNCSNASPTDITTLSILKCTIVPVKLKSWGGDLNTGSTILRWRTENEIMPVSYEVFRSSDGVTYRSAGTVAGRSESGPANEYTFSLASGGGTWYYRLKLTPLTGSSFYSEVIILSDELTTEFRIKANGNPFRDHIRISVTLPEKGRLSLRLLDMYGKIVATHDEDLDKGSHMTGMDGLSILPSGVYMLRADCGANRSLTKLVKE
jgi:hypothetical protein